MQCALASQGRRKPLTAGSKHIPRRARQGRPSSGAAACAAPAACWAIAVAVIAAVMIAAVIAIIGWALVPAPPPSAQVVRQRARAGEMGGGAGWMADATWAHSLLTRLQLMLRGCRPMPGRSMLLCGMSVAAADVRPGHPRAPSSVARANSASGRAKAF
jgi:hypothetical protein